MPSMLWGGCLFAVVGVLFFWMLASIH